ncbi:GNAT family N-acetyltransferase [Roseibium sp. SCPC15]|uniref:GNAT family N-acetyltransferase n=1 Tax=Roseibium sp. SCP15 TaxID=3141376 RepID=UPI00333A1944
MDQTTTEQRPYNLRTAVPSDFSFCRKLYIETIFPLLEALDCLDRQRAEKAFKSYFKCHEISLVVIDDDVVGWFQVSEETEQINLDQVYLISAYRNRGLGTLLIRDVMQKAASKGKPLHLSMIKGNPAITLYQRLGFAFCGEDDIKFHMLWE